MAIDPTDTTEAPEEPIASPDEGGSEGTPAADPPKDDPPAAAAPADKADQAASAEQDAGAQFMALVEETFKEDVEAGHDPAKLAGLISREQLERMPPATRAAFRALAGALKPRADALEADKTAWEAKKAAEQKKLDEGVAELRRRSLALHKAVNFEQVRKAAGEKPPEGIDPTTPDGLRKLAAHEARKAAAEGVLDIFKDVETTRAAAAREAFEDELREQYPVLRDPAVSAEFIAFLQKENEGVKGPPWRVDARTGARLFVAERANAEAIKRANEARANEAADRAASARNMNRVTTGGGAPAPRGIPREVYEEGRVTAYLQSLSPAERARVLAEERRAAH